MFEKPTRLQQLLIDRETSRILAKEKRVAKALSVILRAHNDPESVVNVKWVMPERKDKWVNVYGHYEFQFKGDTEKHTFRPTYGCWAEVDGCMLDNLQENTLKKINEFNEFLMQWERYNKVTDV